MNYHSNHVILFQQVDFRGSLVWLVCVCMCCGGLMLRPAQFCVAAILPEVYNGIDSHLH